MKLYCCLLLVSCGLICALSCQTTWADEQADPKEKDAVADDAAAAEKNTEKPAQEKKSPPRIPPALDPHSFEIPVPRQFAVPTAKPQPAKKQPAAKEQQAALPAPQHPNAPLRRPQGRPQHRPQGQPQQRALNAGAVYRLGGMGRNAQLTPAMQFYLNRSGGANLSPATRFSPSTTSAASQGATRFYPGVSRLPAQKPFSNIVRQPNAIERYWPLLLEGRQDRNTGLIIWTLP